MAVARNHDFGILVDLSEHPERKKLIQLLGEAIPLSPIWKIEND